MNYGVRRINHTADCAQYHLFDHRAMLQLVADYGSPWVPAHQMRLARPDGKSVASLTLPKPLFARLRRPTANLASYALVMENAVYAVINRLQPSAANQSRTPYYVIEVESQKWLVLALAEQAGCFALYSTVPPNLAFTPLHQVALPAAVGQIAAATLPLTIFTSPSNQAACVTSPTFSSPSSSSLTTHSKAKTCHLPNKKPPQESPLAVFICLIVEQ